jgi:hypothetical protein
MAQRKRQGVGAWIRLRSSESLGLLGEYELIRLQQALACGEKVSVRQSLVLPSAVTAHSFLEQAVVAAVPQGKWQAGWDARAL